MGFCEGFVAWNRLNQSPKAVSRCPNPPLLGSPFCAKCGERALQQSIMRAVLHPDWEQIQERMMDEAKARAGTSATRTTRKVAIDPKDLGRGPTALEQLRGAKPRQAPSPQLPPLEDE